jgi:hypothetical protein
MLMLINVVDKKDDSFCISLTISRALINRRHAARGEGYAPAVTEAAPLRSAMRPPGADAGIQAANVHRSGSVTTKLYQLRHRVEGVAKANGETVAITTLAGLDAVMKAFERRARSLLQSEARPIDARPQADRPMKTSCDARTGPNSLVVLVAHSSARVSNR